MAKAFVKIDKEIAASLIKEPRALGFYVYCALRADHLDKMYRGIPIASGSFASTEREMAQETGIPKSTIHDFLSRPDLRPLFRPKTDHGLTIITISDSAVCKGAKNDLRPKTDQDSDQVSDHPIYKNKTIKNKTIKNKISPLSPLYEIFNLFLDYRRELHKPLPEASHAEAFAQLERLSAGEPERAEDIVRQSIRNGWVTLVPLRKEDKDGEGSLDAIDRMRDEAIDMIMKGELK